MKETRNLRKNYMVENSSLRNAAKAVRIYTVKVFVTHLVRRKSNFVVFENLAKSNRARIVDRSGAFAPPLTKRE